MKELKSIVFLLSTLLMCIGSLAIETYSQTYNYNQFFGKEKHSFTYSESRVEKEFKIVLSYKERSEICFLDSNYFCLKWIYKDNLNGADFTAIRTLDSIHIKGNNDGSAFNNSIKIGSQPWLQFWECGIAKMISSGKKEMAFSSIDANKPSKAATFLVNKKGLTTVKIGNQNEEANLITITIKGLPAIIFTAKMWFRKKDNVFLKSEMPEGPLIPITRIEIQN